MSDKQFTKHQLIKYTDTFGRYLLAEYRFNNENDYRLKEILEDDVERAYKQLLDYRKALGMEQ